MDFKDYISLIAIVISTISLAVSLYERRVKILIYLCSDVEGYYLEIYNHSRRKIIISHFDIYRAKHKYFYAKNYADTWYSDGDTTKYNIEPYECKIIKFHEAYGLEGFMKKAQNQHTYISLFVSGKKSKIIRLR